MITITVLSVKIFLHGRFHSLNAAMVEVRESDHVTKHRAIRVDAGGIALEVNAAQVLRAQFLFQRDGGRFRHLALQNDVTPVALQFFRQFARWNVQRVTEQRNERLAIIQVGRIGHDRLDRDIVGEDFVVRVQNRAALSVDRLVCKRVFPRRARRTRRA